MEIEELRRRVSEIKWFHTINLGNGVVTPGVDDTPQKLLRIRMPEDLSGQAVLDFGAWDGFFSFEAECRGAETVVASDPFAWNGNRKKGFDLARETLGSCVQESLVDVMDFSPETVGTFDLVLFLGVLYHLRHPFLALERVASITNKCLILESAVDQLGSHSPVMAFYPGTERRNDPTNWWAPNPSALLGMLKDVGFSRVEVVSPPKPRRIRIFRAIKKWLKEGRNPITEYNRDRIVVHAWK